MTIDKRTMLSVNAIEMGTVIDHIPAGQGLNILRYFRLDELGCCVTVGFNLRTVALSGQKDLIKIDGKIFSEDEINLLSLFAPQATVNKIEDYRVQSKHTPRLPEKIFGLFPCPNSNCATHGEPVQSEFYTSMIDGVVHLKCIFCEKTYPMDWIIRQSVG